MINRKSLLLSFFLGLTLSVSAQQIYFPKGAIADSLMLAGFMPGFAKKVIAVYKPKNEPKTYLDHLFRLQMTAGEYDQATSTINALRGANKPDSSLFPQLTAIQYELFSKAKLKEATDANAFQETLGQYFHTTYQNLPDKAALSIYYNFSSPLGVNGLRDALQNSLAKQTGKDSIAIDQAITLCENYNELQVYRVISPIAWPLLREDDQKRYTIQDSVLIKTRDGAYINAIVVRRKANVNPLPAVLQFSIYTGAAFLIPKDAAANGYVGVLAFSRGKRLSPNEPIPYQFDGQDAYDVIDWISKQSWCNGKVGMYGGSYTGFTQWAAAKHLHPALKTIVPSASAAPGLDVPMMNNVFESFTFPWIYYVTNNKYLDFADYNNTAQWDSLNTKWYTTGKPYRELDSLTGRGANKIFQTWIMHPSYDSYWQAMIPYKQDFAQINIPVLTTTGYYDGGQVGALYYFREHNKYNKKSEHYLIIGPYSHYGSQGFVSTPDPEPIIAGYQIDPVANIHIHQIIFQWFDYVLKGGPKPAILKDKVNYQVMGSNEWKHAASLNKMNNDTLRFYLDNARTGNHCRLSSKKPLKKGFLTEDIDLADRKTFNTFDHTDTIIYNKLDSSNGHVFISDPVKKPFNINGCFFGEMKAEINKKDMDYNLTLYELMPNGKYFYLSYFMGRASYAADHNIRKLLIPGQINTISFTNSYMTSKNISAGSRIVIVLSVNKSRDNQINYGTGKDVSHESIEDAKIPLKIKWYNDSFVDIPVWR